VIRPSHDKEAASVEHGGLLRRFDICHQALDAIEQAAVAQNARAKMRGQQVGVNMLDRLKTFRRSR